MATNATGWLVTPRVDPVGVFGYGDTKSEAEAMARGQFSGVSPRDWPRCVVREQSRHIYQARVDAFLARMVAWSKST